MGLGYYNEIPLSTFVLVRPILFMLDPETAHRAGVRAAGLPWILRKLGGMVDSSERPEELRTTVWGLKFDNPIGMAAGWDKNAESIDGALDMGFGFVEIGSVTPKPQDGNPKPRVFRLKADKCVINRYGFNSEGHDRVRDRLQQRLSNADTSTGLLGVNLGKNKTSPSAVDDFCNGVRKLGEFGDYIVVNVSSPNTPGLRSLQGKKELNELLSAVKQTRDELFELSNAGMSGDPFARKPTPLLVKIAPDLNNDDMEDIADVCKDVKIDGIIVSNTTLARPDTLVSKERKERGGLSGAILMDHSTKILSEMYRLTDGKIPLIGAGGVQSGADAYRKIKAGASLVQLYSSLVYKGPAMIPRMKRELAELVKADGYQFVHEAVGADHRTVGCPPKLVAPTST